MAHTFFDTDEDRNFSISALQSLTKFATATHSPSHHNASSGIYFNKNITIDEVKLAYNMSQKFEDEKFSSKIGEDIEEYFNNYETAATDYKLDENMKLQYLHNLFDEEPRRFYREKVANSTHSYLEAKQLSLIHI